MTSNQFSVIGGRLQISPEMSARLGIPNGMEFWRYNLIYAARNMDGYGAAMRNMDNSNLHLLLDLYDKLESIARRNPGLIVPIELNEDLHIILDEVRQRIRTEASRRGVSLIPWTTAQVRQ